MLYNQNNLNCAVIASKSDNRPEIAGVLFKSDRTCATDGFRLLEVRVPADVRPEDFPMVDGKAAMRGVQSFIVPARSVREIKIPKAKTGFPIIARAKSKRFDYVHKRELKPQMSKKRRATIA